MWELLPTCRNPALKLLCVLKVLGRSNSVPNFSIVSLCIMQLCEHVFPIGLHYMCPKIGFWGLRCENIVFWPSKGTTLHEYASVSHVKIGSTAWALGPWKDLAYNEERNKKKLSGNFGYMGEVTAGAILWGDIVDVITCAIFRDCRLRGVGVVRGVSLLSPIDLTVYRPQCKVQYGVHF